MEDTLFNSEAKRSKAVAQLRRLCESEDWVVLADVLDANIEVLEARIVVGEGTRDEIDRLRDRLAVYKDIRDTPNTLLKRLTEKDKEIPNPDPYYTAEDLKKMERMTY